MIENIVILAILSINVPISYFFRENFTKFKCQEPVLADGVRHRLHNLYIDVVHVMLNYVLGIKIKGVIIKMTLVAVDLKIIFLIIGLYVNVFSNN